jgi:tetratricopeptide (TPR) repeat protein
MIDLDERVDEAHYYLGRIAEDEGDLKGALYQYKQVKGGRDFLSAHNRVGLILMEAGEVEQSHQYYSLLRDRQPEQREPLYGLEAELLNSAGMLEASLAILNQGLSEFPDSSALLYSRSMLGEELGDLEMMENDLRTILAKDRALVLQPGEPAILDSMGWVLYRQGDYEQSIKYLRQAYDKFPDPEVAAHLGEVLWVSGDEKAAMEIWQDALLKDPEHQVLVATIKRLGVTALDVGH